MKTKLKTNCIAGVSGSAALTFIGFFFALLKGVIYPDRAPDYYGDIAWFCLWPVRLTQFLGPPFNEYLAPNLIFTFLTWAIVIAVLHRLFAKSNQGGSLEY